MMHILRALVERCEQIEVDEVRGFDWGTALNDARAALSSPGEPKYNRAREIVMFAALRQPAPTPAEPAKTGVVQGESFVRAWLQLDKLPGSMMIGPEGRFGPVPASSSCWVTTSERERDRLLAKGESMLEVWTTPPTPEAEPAQQDTAEFQQFLSDVLTAAGLVEHGKQSKALAIRLGDGCMKFRAPSVQQAAATEPKALKSLPEEIADALRPFLCPGQKVIWRMPFRWHDDNGVLSNHYDGFSVRGLAEDFGYTVIVDAGEAAIIAALSAEQKGENGHG